MNTPEKGKKSYIILCEECGEPVPHRIYLVHLVENDASKKNCPYCLNDSLEFKTCYGLPPKEGAIDYTT